MELPKDYLYRLYRMPSVRYHDTSFVLYRKWLRAEDELAFPTIHKYVLTSAKTDDKITKPDYYLTDSECTYTNQTKKRIDLDAVNRNKRKSRRRTRSLEKRKATKPNGTDNVTERFIASKVTDIKDSNNDNNADHIDDGLSLRASENKIRIRVEANHDDDDDDDDAAKVQQDQSKSDKLRIIEAEKRCSGSAIDIGTVPAETIGDESDSSEDSCYDAFVAGQRMESQNQQSLTDFIAVDVHSEPRPLSGLQRSSRLIITEPCDLKETKESVPVINNDKENSRSNLFERQISCTSDESASESYSLDESPSYAAIGRGSSLRSSVQSATSASSSNYFVTDHASDVESISTDQKSNDDRIDSNQQTLPKLDTQTWSRKTLPAPSQHKKKPAIPSLRLHYVTERILAYILPAKTDDFDEHDQYEKEVIPMLEQKHGQNYQLFNLETCISVITLERICELCKHIDKLLGSGQEKVVVLQDREDCQRLGATIIAFLEYLRICASNYQTRHINGNDDKQVQNTIARNWMNLDMYSMKKFLETNIEPLHIPSYKRYIRYFSGLLSGQIKLNASPLHLNSISIESPPSFLQYNGVSSKSEWSSYIKIYEGLQCVYTSDIHIIPITTRQFLYQIGNLRLRGDILIRCYQIGSSASNFERESKQLVFSVQFHTCAIKTKDVVFVKEDLDFAHNEPQFPNDCKVSFHFNADRNSNNFLFQSPLIRTEQLSDANKANSIENLDLRPTLASSVSPSSFPSQVSPQEDRHRELDDILSDMLLTVQDIPDFQNRKSSTRSINQYDRSQSVVSHVSANAPASASSPVYTLPIQSPPAHNINRDLLHNSHSYVTQENVQRHSNSNSYNKQDRFDPYDTASTTTTLTPPPSESGRDTPNLLSGYHSSTSNISRQQQQQPRRETNTIAPMPLQHSQMASQQPHTTAASLGQTNSQHQSATYQRVVRTSNTNNPNSLTSEDEDNIPYHAREHSQPFTYGNLPSNGVHLNDVSVSVSVSENQQKDPRMIKAQSGLTSPMLVRKTFGGGGGITNDSSYNTLRKPDFEEMLRERREKVMSEKYSISDKQSTGTNGYHNYYNEPLKRSNTLDGFHRSTSTNELSGQTWLQLQQQKLRAKKNAQLKDDRKYFEEIHTEIKNRPLRSRNIARFDGYASDTAAFDEVDYRRPLHVQTPYHTSNSSPERHYHTISTTTKTVTKERPFVAVRRSHETAKQEKLGVREESFSSYRSETDQDLSIAGSPRPETPAFPVTPRTPYGLHNGSISPGIPPRSPTPQRRLYNSTWSLRSIRSTASTLDRSKDIYGGTQKGLFQEMSNQNDTLYRTRINSNTSNANSEPQEVAPHLVKFVRDSSKFWYKPNLSREEAIELLRNATPGTFIVRDSTTFKNAYGLVVRVAQPPPGVTASPGSEELVRHFLVEPTTRGVRLKGCANEPVFSSLSALVYQHSITQLALPCRLIIPDNDIQPIDLHTPAQKQLLTQGAACNVLYLYSCGTESLTGEEAVRRAVGQLFSTMPLPKPTEVHFKVAQQGITLTDNTRQKFFRKHYNAHNISFCGTDPEHRQWSVRAEDGVVPVSNKTIFAFVARRSPSSKDNQCHVFCDLAVSQPATAIVSFANKVLPTEQQPNRNI